MGNYHADFNYIGQSFGRNEIQAKVNKADSYQRTFSNDS